MVSISKNIKAKIGWAIKHDFSIYLHKKDLPLLISIKEFFGVGRVYLDPKKQTAVYSVAKISDLINVIIPFFTKYSLITQKRADFLLFKSVVELMEKKRTSNCRRITKDCRHQSFDEPWFIHCIKESFPWDYSCSKTKS